VLRVIVFLTINVSSDTPHAVVAGVDSFEPIGSLSFLQTKSVIDLPRPNYGSSHAVNI
jgi:hypothetical protein